jgi:predicted glutamine amidotransferase
MCRLAAFPPNFPRMEAIELLMNFEDQNTDGTGSVYVKDGKFIVNKWAKSLTKVLTKEAFLTHMPYPGWTVAHLRAASHGANLKVNTHPFTMGRWAVVHNGVWSEYNIAKLALSKFVEFEGDTDSEVAAHLINIVGPKKVAEEIDFGGVFLALNIDGSLWSIKTSGDLEMAVLKKGERVLIASEFDDDKYKETYEALNGWYHFDKDGKYMKHKKIRDSFMTRFRNSEYEWLNDKDDDEKPRVRAYQYWSDRSFGNNGVGNQAYPKYVSAGGYSGCENSHSWD